MLTISKPLSAGQAQTYHAKEFTAKEQNYWSQKGEIKGEWQGANLPADLVWPEQFLQLTLHGSARVSTQKQASNWSDNMLPTNTREETASP